MKKLIIGIVVVVVVILGVLMLTGSLKRNSLQTGSPSPTPKQTIVINTVPLSQLPSGLPAGLPLEAGATITQNYTTTNPNGLPLAVREFISKKTLAENLTIYKTSLTDAGWTISNVVNDPTIKIIEAKKGAVSVRILIHTNDKNQVIVSIQATGK